MTSEVDVLVVGGGPAGAAAALVLARGGRSAAVLTRERGNRPRIGETVPPTVLRSLVRLGLWDAFRADGHAPAPGTVVCWGSARPYEHEFLLDPYGDGWHLDRPRFDAMVLEGARTAGAQVEDLPPGSRIDHDGTGWCARWGDDSARVLRAPFLVDATGRGAGVAARLGIPRRRADRQIALFRFGTAATTEPRTLIEACPEGWWYAAVLPRQRSVLALFTDADLVPAGAAAREAHWARTLADTHLVRQIEVDPDPSRLHAAPATSSALAVCAGRSWLAVGDAARTLDPLSGQGLCSALDSAHRAAEVILGGCGEAALAAYVRRGAEEQRIHLSTRREHYRRENRWPDRPFWRRRHTADHHASTT